MPRAKEFDPDEVLEQAMELFWEQGFEATSAQDLVDRTGLNRSSLYNTFGCKQDLYLAALDRYRRQGNEALAAQLARDGSAHALLRDLFEEVVCAATGDSKRRGCFVANATVERARCDEETRERTRQSLTQMQKGFCEIVERGQAQGEIAPQKDAQAIGRFLSGVYYGLQTMGKTGLPREMLDDVVETALQVLT